MLSVAKEHPNLLVVKGATNVIEEIGRTSLRVASLIHEYTDRNFTSQFDYSLIEFYLKLVISQDALSPPFFLII